MVYSYPKTQWINHAFTHSWGKEIVWKVEKGK